MTNLQTLENQTNVGFIGIGNMGFAMMARLLSQNWPATAFDMDANAMKPVCFYWPTANLFK